MTYQSPFPRHLLVRATVGERPEYPPLDGSVTADVAIIGGGFTGLSAAAHLAKAGTNVVLIDQHRFGDGASGRNGGQLGTGQRAWAEEYEAELGFTRAKALFDLAEEAKAHLLEFAETNGIDIDYRPGQMSVVHKKRYLKDYQAHPALMAERFGYPHISYMDANETARRLGSTHYLGGIRDTGTGHIHPLKLVVGTARVAAAAGAQLHENTPATKIESSGGKVTITTPRGTITAAKALIAVNAYGGNLEDKSAAHIMPIGSFIGATVPLGDDSPVLPGGESGRRFALRGALFPQVERRAAAVRRARDLFDRRPEGHRRPYPPADRRGLSRAEGCRDHPSMGRLCRHHHAAQALSCARSCRTSSRRAAIRATA